MPKETTQLGRGIKAGYKPKPVPEPVVMGKCCRCLCDLKSGELVWWMWRNKYYCWPCHEACPTEGVFDMLDLHLDAEDFVP